MVTLGSLPTPPSEYAAPLEDIVETASQFRRGSTANSANASCGTSAGQISSNDDRELIDELLARSRGASQRFIARYDAFFRNVISWSSPAARPVVDDLTQEVYVCLWAHDFRVLRQWKCEHPLRAYLQTVIARLVWERLSRLQPRREILGDDPPIKGSAQHDHSAIPATPEQLVCAHELVRIVCGALKGLNARDRHVLELRYFHDLSYREIADVLRVTPTNAGVRLARALGRLREVLIQRAEELDVSEFEVLSFAEGRPLCNKTDGFSLI